MLMRNSSPAMQSGQLLTAERLQQYDGQEHRPIYLAVLGQVFDVTSGRRHYGQQPLCRFFLIIMNLERIMICHLTIQLNE